MDSFTESSVDQPVEKKMKINDTEVDAPICKHYVKRKKRFCKMTVAKGKQYCGEHLSESAKESDDRSIDRIPCPLDPKHSIYSKNLRKHLKICNARPKEEPEFIVRGINMGVEVETDPSDAMKLVDFSYDDINKLIDRVDKVYKDEIKGIVADFFFEHSILRSELDKSEYGPETLKHLVQTSSILGALNRLDLLTPKTCFIDFGSGKGQLSYWLARAVEKLENANVVLVDRASHRHKKDNKIEDKSFIHRIRADISDFDIRRLEILAGKQVVIVSKHLCGGATDLALRCMAESLKSSETAEGVKIKGFFIALCCYHRCDWRSFVGKKGLLSRGFTRKDFNLITKLVSWAVSGSGMSRERKRLLDEQQGIDDLHVHEEVDENRLQNKISLERREEVGKMCKRLLDFCRIEYIQQYGFETNLRYYVKSDVTLENVCIVGKYTRPEKL